MAKLRLELFQLHINLRVPSQHVNSSLLYWYLHFRDSKSSLGLYESSLVTGQLCASSRAQLSFKSVSIPHLQGCGGGWLPRSCPTANTVSHVGSFLCPVPCGLSGKYQRITLSFPSCRKEREAPCHCMFIN